MWFSFPATYQLQVASYKFTFRRQKRLLNMSLLCEKILPPCHHISINSPCLKRLIFRISVRCRNIGIAVHSKINERDKFHLLLACCCTSQILLKEVLTFLPGCSHLSTVASSGSPNFLVNGTKIRDKDEKTGGKEKGTQHLDRTE